jgi:hypothetical protein
MTAIPSAWHAAAASIAATRPRSLRPRSFHLPNAPEYTAPTSGSLTGV